MQNPIIEIRHSNANVMKFHFVLLIFAINWICLPVFHPNENQPIIRSRPNGRRTRPIEISEHNITITHPSCATAVQSGASVDSNVFAGDNLHIRKPETSIIAWDKITTARYSRQENKISDLGGVFHTEYGSLQIKYSLISNSNKAHILSEL